MAKRIWHKAKYPGVRYYDHGTRKYRGQPDRYYYYRYMVEGFEVAEGVGYASEGWTEKTVADLRAEFRANAKKADGSARTLKERREAHTRKVAEKQADKDTQKTVEEWGREYIATLPEGKPRDDDANRLERFVYPSLGESNPFALEVADIEKLVRKIQKMAPNNRWGKPMKGKKISPRTIEQVITTFGKVMRFAKVPNSPVSKRVVPKYNNQALRYLEKWEARALMDCLEERSCKAYEQAMVSLYTGMRAKEVFSLRVMNIRFYDRQIHILDSKNAAQQRTPRITAAIEPILRKRCEGKKMTDLLWPKNNGGQQDDVNTVYYRVIEDLGFNEGISDRRYRVDFHTLRHTWASWLIQSAKVTLAELQKMGGWETFEMVQRYAKFAPESFEKAHDVAENFL